LTQRIVELDRRIDEALKEHQELRESAERLQTVKGVGPVTVATVLALLPELGTLNPAPDRGPCGIGAVRQ
jgi:transposase